jgi:hypothetical protein
MKTGRKKTGRSLASTGFIAFGFCAYLIMALPADSSACEGLGVTGDDDTNAKGQHQCHDQIGLTLHCYQLLTFP